MVSQIFWCRRNAVPLSLARQGVHQKAARSTQQRVARMICNSLPLLWLFISYAPVSAFTSPDLQKSAALSLISALLQVRLTLLSYVAHAEAAAVAADARAAPALAQGRTEPDEVHFSEQVDRADPHLDHGRARQSGLLPGVRHSDAASLVCAPGLGRGTRRLLVRLDHRDTGCDPGAQVGLAPRADPVASSLDLPAALQPAPTAQHEVMCGVWLGRQTRVGAGLLDRLGASPLGRSQGRTVSVRWPRRFAPSGAHAYVQVGG